MRGAYTRHPRVMMLAHNQNLMRLDLREHGVDGRPGLLPSSRPLVINGFEKSPLHMFQFALQVFIPSQSSMGLIVFIV